MLKKNTREKPIFEKRRHRSLEREKGIKQSSQEGRGKKEKFQRGRVMKDIGRGWGGGAFQKKSLQKKTSKKNGPKKRNKNSKS